MLIGYAGGRYAQPARVEIREKVVTKTVEVAAKTKEDTSVATREADIRTVTKWRIRTVEKPNGDVVTSAAGSTGTESSTKDHNEKTARETEVVYRDRVVTQETVKVVQSDRPDWGLAAGAGIRGGPAAVYRAEVSRRIVGPIWLGAYGSTGKEAGLMLRLEF